MLAFLAAVFFLLITPGPGVLSAAGVGSAFGARTGYRYVFGLFVGANLVALAVISGVASLLFAQTGIRQVLLYAAVLYLCYLAATIALSGSRLAFISRVSAPGIVDGIALQVINPKAYAVYTTLFTGFAFVKITLLQEILLKIFVINMIWIPIHLLWLGAGIGLKQLALPERWQRAINVAMAFSLLCVIVLALRFGQNA
jgi:threonine/homoserine/homoserine lactone efflux protein